MKYKSNHNVVYSCKYHVVWCPKYRRSVLINGVDIRLKELIKETCNQLNVEIIEMEIMPDHVHLLMEVDPQLCKSQYNNVGLGQNNIVVFPTFLFCPNRFQ